MEQQKRFDANKIIDIIANRAAARTATSDKEVAFLIAENEELKAKVKELEEQLKEKEKEV